MGIDWQLFVTPGLGDNSYLLYSEDQAVIVDPQRDAWRFLEFAHSRKLRIRYVLETHVHNDYVSGSLEVRDATGAEVAAPAKGNYKFDHLRVSEGLELRIGTARIKCWETPGHTLDHVSWVVFEEDDEDPVVLFSGGSLLVGGAGRTDLFGEKWTKELTRKQYQSIQRINKLPTSVAVLPTHGAGSFCAAGGERKERVTTIGTEQQQNRL
ncbi:MAG: MBL fold metallo-hydrolase, partial [Acidobacteriota bacterium]